VVRAQDAIGELILRRRPRKSHILSWKVYVPIRADCCILFNFSISMMAVVQLSLEMAEGKER
jgi:hypothetical protein